MATRLLCTWFGDHSPRSRKCLSARRKTPLGLESLEERATPTVVFIPYFGLEVVSGSNVGMQSPPVYLIFSGSYWKTSQGQQDETTLLNSAQEILSGPYLSGLTQYGSDGKAIFARSWQDNATVPSKPSADALQNFLQTSIALITSATPGPHDAQQCSPIYVVVSDPNSSQQYNGGWNALGSYSYSTGGFLSIVTYQDMHMIWLGTSTAGTGVSKDAFTETLSHELAETISDPDANGITVTTPPGLPSNMINGSQIGDNEPEQANCPHYGYSLNGDVVQPYWSRKDNAFIVPDGTAQQTYRVPNWIGNTFMGTYSTMKVSYAVGPAGSRFAGDEFILRDDGTLAANGGSGWVTWETGVTSFAFGSGPEWGNYVVALQSNGQLMETNGGPPGFQEIASGVTSFAFGSGPEWGNYLVARESSGELMETNDGPPGFHEIASGVTSFAFGTGPEWGHYLLARESSGELAGD